MASVALEAEKGASCAPSREKLHLSAAVRSLFAPVDPASLWVFRVFFGLIMVGATTRFWANGWIEKHYIAPKLFFPFAGFEWIRPWQGSGMYIHFAVMGVAALFIALGLFYRLSAATFFVLFTYAHLIDKTHYLNHYYFVSLIAFLLIFLPLNRVGSMDRALGIAKGPRTIPAWALWLLRFQVGVVYFFAGVAKLKTDWLFHAEPLTIWLGANTDFPWIGPLFRYKATAFVMSWGGAAFDLSVPFALSVRRTRYFAYGAVVAFHLLTGSLFPIGVFPWIMTFAALILFPADWPRSLVPKRLAKHFVPPSEITSQHDVSAPPTGSNLGLQLAQKATLLALAGYALIQILVPLRHNLYSGNVSWTEQGFRFSWKVMLVEKNGDVAITVVDPHSGKRWKIDNREYLQGYQIKQMSFQPDMILYYCQFIANTFREKGYPDIQVFADAQVAWNGRAPAPLVDPKVDLGRERESFGPYPFLLPAPDSAPQL